MKTKTKRNRSAGSGFPYTKRELVFILRDYIAHYAQSAGEEQHRYSLWLIYEL
jgi:hypothetical protein